MYTIMYPCIELAHSIPTPTAVCRVPLALRSVAAMSSIPRRKVLPEGVWPTMITPFLGDEKKSIDWNGIDCESNQSRVVNIPADLKTATILASN